MFPSDLPFDASCVVVWLPPGVVPTGATFSPANVQSPPYPNPEAFWFYHEALMRVMEADRSHGKVPWIKFGTNVLDQDKIKAEHARLLRASSGANPVPAPTQPPAPAGEGEV